MKIVISQESSNPITITTESSCASDYLLCAAKHAAMSFLIRQFPLLIKAIYSKCANYISDIRNVDDFLTNRKFIKCVENTKKKYKDDDIPTLAEVERDYRATTKSKFICNLFDSHKDPNIDAGAKNMNVYLRRVCEVPVCVVRIPEPRPNKKIGIKKDVLASTMFVKNKDKIKSIPLARAEVNFSR